MTKFFERTISSLMGSVWTCLGTNHNDVMVNTIVIVIIESDTSLCGRLHAGHWNRSEQNISERLTAAKAAKVFVEWV